MRYEDALAYLDTPNFMNPDPGLENIGALLDELGNPQDKLRYVHIAGTNGKGSTAAMLEQILRESGYRVGLYTSPYIDHFSEKIRVNGKEIPEEDVTRLASVVKAAANVVQGGKGLLPTVFELVTALAFLYFFEEKCDIVVLEVGLGGRLDATNIIKQSEVSVITAIGLDHTDILGSTVEEIAREKAGIIKEAGTVVLYEQEAGVMDEVSSVCAEKRASLTIAPVSQVEISYVSGDGQTFSCGRHRNLVTEMLGLYQMRNAVVALYTAEMLRGKGWRISEEALRDGLCKARWSGRLEICGRDPLFLVDAAHNLQGAAVLAESLEDLFAGRRFVFVVGVLGDKDYEKMIDIVLPLAEAFFVVTPNSARALEGSKLKSVIEGKGGKAVAFDTVQEAVTAARKAALELDNSIACAFGSLYYIGEVISCLREM